jgi:hypothetical protein
MGAKFSLKISSKWGICPLGFSLKVEGYFLSPVVTQRKDRLMSKKYKTKVELVPWMSARPDNVENRFIQVGNSLLFNKEFQSLGAGSQMLYLCMSMESAGKRKFVFPQAAAKKYKISPSSLRRHVDELEAKGFIKVYSGKATREPNLYEFCYDWKIAPRPRACAPPLAISSKSVSK